MSSLQIGGRCRWCAITTNIPGERHASSASELFGQWERTGIESRGTDGTLYGLSFLGGSAPGVLDICHNSS